MLLSTDLSRSQIQPGNACRCFFLQQFARKKTHSSKHAKIGAAPPPPVLGCKRDFDFLRALFCKDTQRYAKISKGTHFPEVRLTENGQ